MRGLVTLFIELPSYIYEYFKILYIFNILLIYSPPTPTKLYLKDSEKWIRFDHII
jgi:hypothetical protein